MVARDYSPVVSHEHHEEPRGGDDWSERGARLELEGEVAIPLLQEAIDAIAARAGSQDDVRVVLDLGSGPGVASALLAERFPLATVTAVDASEQLLDRARARAARAAVAERVTARVADLERDLDDVAAAGTVDVVWASMVLHHLATLPRALADVHRRLRPAGLLAIVEFGTRSGPLPIGFDAGRDGFAARLAEARRAAIEGHLPPGALSLAWPALLDDAGYDVLEQRELVLELPAPLDDTARRLVHLQLAGSARMAAGRLDDADLDHLSGLVAADDPRCVLRRDDLSFEMSRTFFLARRR